MDISFLYMNFLHLTLKYSAISRGISFLVRLFFSILVVRVFARLWFVSICRQHECSCFGHNELFKFHTDVRRNNTNMSFTCIYTIKVWIIEIVHRLPLNYITLCVFFRHNFTWMNAWREEKTILLANKRTNHLQIAHMVYFIMWTFTLWIYG